MRKRVRDDRVVAIGAALLMLAVLGTACGTRVEGTAVGTVGLGPGSASGGDLSGGGVAGNNATGQGPSGGAQGSTSALGSSEGVTGSSSVGSTGTVNRSPIVIGAVGTRTGVVGASQESAWQGLFTWVRWVNAKGGINGRQVKLIMSDDGGDPGRNATDVRQLIEDNHVVAFVGPMAPITFSAGLPIMEQYHIPAIAGDSAEKGWFESPYAFPLNGGALPEGRAIGRYAAAKLSQSKLAIFYLAEVAFGKTYADYMRDEWLKAGKQVLFEASISLAQPDFTAEVLRAKSAGADAVMIATEATGIRRFLDAAQRQNYTTPVFFGPLTSTEPVVAQSPLVDRLYVSDRFEPPSTNIPAERELAAAVARFDPEMSPIPSNFINGWAAGRIFELVMAASGGKTDPASLVDALHRLKHVDLGGLFAPIDWPPGPHPERPCGKVVHYDGQLWRSLTPEFLC